MGNGAGRGSLAAVILFGTPATIKRNTAKGSVGPHRPVGHQPARRLHPRGAP